MFNLENNEEFDQFTGEYIGEGGLDPIEEFGGVDELEEELDDDMVLSFDGTDLDDISTDEDFNYLIKSCNPTKSSYKSVADCKSKKPSRCRKSKWNDACSKLDYSHGGSSSTKGTSRSCKPHKSSFKSIQDCKNKKPARCRRSKWDSACNQLKYSGGGSSKGTPKAVKGESMSSCKKRLKKEFGMRAGDARKKCKEWIKCPLQGVEPKRKAGESMSKCTTRLRKEHCWSSRSERRKKCKELTKCPKKGQTPQPVLGESKDQCRKRLKDQYCWGYNARRNKCKAWWQDAKEGYKDPSEQGFEDDFNIDNVPEVAPEEPMVEEPVMDQEMPVQEAGMFGGDKKKLMIVGGIIAVGLLGLLAVRAVRK